MNKRTLAALVAALVVTAGCLSDSPENSPVLPNPPADTPAQGRKATPKPAGIGDGQHAVGPDIKAGTYTTTVPEDSLGCYWARVNDFEGELQSILANGNLEPGAKGRIVVKSGDAGVEFKGGCEWKKAAK
jgi:hypothetical protein